MAELEMEAFYGSDAVVIRYARDLAFVSIEDDLEIEILTQDVRAFLAYIKSVDLDEMETEGGTYYGKYKTIISFVRDLSEVIIEDEEGRRIHTTSFGDFARAMRDKELKAVLSANGLEGML